jgi:hypothetical protein
VHTRGLWVKRSVSAIQPSTNHFGKACTQTIGRLRNRVRWFMVGLVTFD